MRTQALFESLEPRRLLATINWDGGGDGTSWHDDANWEGDLLPGPLDHVVINRIASDPTIVFSTGDVSIYSLRCREDLTITGGRLVAFETNWMSGTLTVSGGTLLVGIEWQQLGPVSLSGGAIDGVGAFALKNTMDWTGGSLGDLSLPSGRFQVTPSGTLNIHGDVNLDRVLVNGGTLNWTSGKLTIERGQLLNMAGRTINVFDDAVIEAGAPNAGLVVNRGTINYAGDISIAARYHQVAGGTTTLAAGSLWLRRSSWIDGTLTTAAGSSFNTSGEIVGNAFNILPTAAVAFGGDVGVGGRTAIKTPGLALDHLILFAGVASLTLPSDTTITTLDLFGGVIGGAGQITVTGLMTWSGGMLVESAADLVIDSGAEFVVQAGAAVFHLRRPVRVFGTMDWEGGQVTTTSTVLIDGSGSFHAGGSGAFTMKGPDAGLTVFGEFSADLGSGTATLVAASTAPGLVLDGGVAIHSGTVRLFGNTAMAGAFSIDAGAVLALGVFEGAPSINPGTVFDGAGTLRLESAPQNAPIELRGTVQTGRLEIQGATVLDDATLAAGATELKGSGAIVGDEDFIIDETFTWRGGYFLGSGRTIVPEDATLSMGVMGLYRVKRTLINRGTIILSHGYLWIEAGGDLRSEAGSTFIITENGSPDGEVRTTHDGAFRVLPGSTLEAEGGAIAGTATSTVQLLGIVHKTGLEDFNLVAFNAETGGLFTIDQGSVLVRYGTHDAAFTIAEGAVLQAAGVGLDQPTFTPVSSVEGAGTLLCGDATFEGSIDVGRLSLQGDAQGQPRLLTLAGAATKRAGSVDIVSGLLSLDENVLLDVSGSLTLMSGGLRVAAASETSHSRIEVAGAFTIDSPPAAALQLSILQDYTPLPGHQLGIISRGSGSGEFGSLEMLPAIPGVTAELEYQPGAILLNFLPA